MYRIRLHGRGGQGMKTASRILGSALFAEGFEVQDAPRYGAERRGAPIFAYVRAARTPIHERGVIDRPDLAVVADDTLVPVPGVLAGIGAQTVVLIRSRESAAAWRERLPQAGAVVTLPAAPGAREDLPFVGAECAAGAARLLGVVPRPALEAAVREELAPLAAEVVAANLERALAVYDGLETGGVRVREGPAAAADPAERPDWIDLPFEAARIAAPDIHAAATSVQVRTGLWRTMRPVIDHGRCHRCHWVCGTLCPDGAIEVDAEGWPHVDYDHCKGCLVCVAVCPTHAISAVPEADASRSAAQGDAADGPAPGAES